MIIMTTAFIISEQRLLLVRRYMRVEYLHRSQESPALAGAGSGAGASAGRTCESSLSVPCMRNVRVSSLSVRQEDTPVPEEKIG